ncbi:sensor domain-containing protein [Cellulomonas fimi]|uniref:PknH-like extracellular domain-containing protein n=1 Tax=Cellulomonas fimi (strain ATCC 484 / DSM 20113 / JCM 1341 / CCUG 24087 / LMG 16345 / NBRC 15513 / NCIMB 8980 / NCTC 7547 / NRS-133) TaxID=590998 RepID=F4H6Q7_CELFA|nr:sensor domain-containing protein [Cellulomonas fimi]AEE46818.1 hypothetical protein Celf_2694 [Cellulomonas fimi ATCC 484]NNH06361.1 hypothetical protein [Cellulomonas fimi]VEH34272.1 Uncharacterised protein [Cellulomonas fimi]
MAGTEPHGGPTPDGSPAPRRRWWWFVAAVVVIAVVLLVARPWAAEPAPTVTALPPATDVTAVPSPTVSVVPPAQDAVFDASTVELLLVTADDVRASVPAARDGIDRTDGGEVVWGLPPGSSVDPAACTTAVTAVAQPPAAFAARVYANDAVVLSQQAAALPDPASARQAFADLVTTVDACPSYAQVNPGTDGGSWTGAPAIEGQGVYPSIVQDVVHTAEGDDVPAYRGHMLVGNVIVSWTASALADASPADALATLGDAESLTAMVQHRAQDAVRSLGPAVG